MAASGWRRQAGLRAARRHQGSTQCDGGSVRLYQLLGHQEGEQQAEGGSGQERPPHVSIYMPLLLSVKYWYIV